MTNEELVRSYRSGDIDCLEILIEKNSGLIKEMCKMFSGIGESEDEIVSLCRIRLWKCAEKFDIDRDKGFYAYTKQSMINHLNQVIQKKNRQRRFAKLESLDKPLPSVKENGITTLADVVPDPDSNYGVEEVDDRDWICDAVLTYFDRMDFMTRGIIEARFLSGYSRQDIADYLGRSREWVRQKEIEVVNELRTILEERNREITGLGRYKGEVYYIHTA